MEVLHEGELDMSDFMEVVAMYRCKFCAETYNSTAELSNHVMEIHSVKVRGARIEEEAEGDDEMILVEETKHENEEEQETFTLMVEEEETQGGEEGVEMMSEEPGMSMDMATDPMEQHYIEDPEQVHESLSGEVGELGKEEVYMCSQCKQDFITIKECREHMAQEHQIYLTDDAEVSTTLPVSTESISFTYEGQNKVSVAIQACTQKKPGRKRKNLQQPAPIIEIVPTMKDDDDEEEDQPQDMLLETDRAAEGKRRIKPPKALIDDYHMGRKVYRDRTPKSQIKAEPTVFLCEKEGCKLKFKSENNLCLHMECHVKEEEEEVEGRFQCTTCEDRFPDWRSCKEHLNTQHNVNTNSLQCEQCDFSTTTMTKLRMHERVHVSRRRTLVCELCGQTFLQSAAMRKHMRNVHNQFPAAAASKADAEEEEESAEDGSKKKVKWFERQRCETCHRVFANAKSLKTHIEVVHDKLKPFACPHCDHTCAKKAMLETHIRIHTGDKPFVCDQCAYASSDHNSMRRHKLRHSGIKKYMCQHCPYSCIQAISLKTHMKNKHPGMKGVFSCDQCQYRTINKQFYDDHIKDHSLGLTPQLPSGSSSNRRPRPRAVRAPRGYVQMVHKDGNMVNVPLHCSLQISGGDGMKASAESYIQMLQNGKMVNVPVLQMGSAATAGNTAGRGSSNTIAAAGGPGPSHQTLLQTLTTAVQNSNQLQRQRIITPASSSSSSSATHAIQISAAAAGSAHSTSHNQHQQVVYTIQQEDGSTLTNLNHQSFSTSSDSSNVLYLQGDGSEVRSIDSSGLQHIITAIQSSEQETEEEEEEGNEIDPVGQTQTYIQAADGTYQLCTVQNGSVAQLSQSQGVQEQVYFEDGTLGLVNVVNNSDGTMVNTSDGTMINASNGTVVNTSDGTMINELDGTIVNAADGTMVNSSEGIMINSSEDGTMVTSSEDGTMVNASDFGTIVTTSNGAAVYTSNNYNTNSTTVTSSTSSSQLVMDNNVEECFVYNQDGGDEAEQQLREDEGDQEQQQQQIIMYSCEEDGSETPVALNLQQLAESGMIGEDGEPTILTIGQQFVNDDQGTV